MGYSAYSIVETGKDEYGYTMPSRFKTFGEYKLPVSIYTIAAFVKIMGLSELSTRLPFILIGIFSPVLFCILTKKLFNNTSIALLSAILASLSPWIQIMARHAHDNIIILFMTCLAVIVLTQLMNKIQLRNIIYISLISGVVLFTSHIGKVLSVYFFLTMLVILFVKKQKLIHTAKYAAIFLLPVLFFVITELQNPTTRVSNLLFMNNQGFTLTIEELRREHDTRLLHNKGTQAVIELTHRYLTYFSPEFLVIKGDDNDRFGFPGISPITPVTYLLFLTGIYFLFHNKEKYRYLLISLLLISPLSASLSWQEYSVTRAFDMIIPILLLAAYGGYNLVLSLKQKQFKLLTAFVLIAGYSFFTFYSWDFYYNHYPKRYDVIFAWQTGYRELNGYIKKNYDSVSKFYMTKELGQPYIYTLFYLQFPPSEYQKQASLTELDEYGFGQVEAFDKFEFHFKKPAEGEQAVHIGYPSDFEGLGIPEDEITKISFNGYDIFWIYNTTE